MAYLMARNTLVTLLLLSCIAARGEIGGKAQPVGEEGLGAMCGCMHVFLKIGL